MSGGSFDYAYSKADDPNRVFEGMTSYKEMEEYARSIGKHDAADEILKYIEWLESTRRRIVVKGSRLGSLMRAIEWECSGDSGLDGIDYAMQKLEE